MKKTKSQKIRKARRNKIRKSDIIEKINKYIIIGTAVFSLLSLSACDKKDLSKNLAGDNVVTENFTEATIEPKEKNDQYNVFDYITSKPEFVITDRIVQAKQTGDYTGTLSLYIKNVSGPNELWQKVFSTECCFGKCGLADNKHEGDKMTPIGIFKIGMAFGINENPGTNIEYTKVTDSMYWVDDVNSKYYNKFVDTSKTDVVFSSGEHLIDVVPQYDYVLNIESNNECVPNNGSAIFLHCFGLADKPSGTSGCISIHKSYMIKILKQATNNTVIDIQKNN